MTRPAMQKESSWAKLEFTNDGLCSDEIVEKRGSQAMKTMPSLNEDRSASNLGYDHKMDEAAFQSSQVTPTPSNPKAKTSIRDEFARMSSWACLGFDDLDELCFSR